MQKLFDSQTIHRLCNNGTISTKSMAMMKAVKKERSNITTVAANSSGSMPISPPSRDQIKMYAIANALPMIGFGFTDQTVMLQAGNAIDCSIGVTFGLSTLTAAAVGQICSNCAGVLFGGTIGNLAKAAGLPSSNLTSLQKSLPIIRRTRIASQMVGIVLGCTLGLGNLLLIDTERSSSLKLQKTMGSDTEIFNFDVEASNDARQDATTFVVRGPDNYGLLANMTSALAVNGCSLMELSARKISGDDGSSDSAHQGHDIEDIFVVVDQKTNEQLSDAKMKELAQILMDTSRLRPNDYSTRMKELEERNTSLIKQIQTLKALQNEEQ